MYKLSVSIELLLIKAGYDCDQFRGIDGNFVRMLHERIDYMSSEELMIFLSEVTLAIQLYSGFELIDSIVNAKLIHRRVA